MSRSSTRCQVCGVVIEPCLIPSDRGVSFPCTRCRTQLELVARDPVPILAASVALYGAKGAAAMKMGTGLLCWLRRHCQGGELVLGRGYSENGGTVEV